MGRYLHLKRQSPSIRDLVSRGDLFLWSFRPILALAIALLLVADAASLMRQPDEGRQDAYAAAGHPDQPAAEAAAAVEASGGDQARVITRSSRRALAKGAGGPSGASPAPLLLDRTGVGTDEIKVVYYWKADSTQNSQYLPADSFEGAVDEGEAFRKLVEWINKHRNDPNPTFLGFRYNLHGRKIRPVVLEAGRNPTDYGATADQIVKKERPFAAVSSHGSLSAYVCPTLAEHGILNLSTYNLEWDLYRKTSGYCVPQGMTWDAQVDAMAAYLKQQATTKYQHPTKGALDRVYGFAYWEYPGLVRSAPEVIERFRAAGINIAKVKSMEADTVTAQRQAPFIIEEFRAAGVNTVIMPDAGAPLALTHAAATNEEAFDYAIWPCSGQDTTAMVRLFDQAQWTRAAGLSCWDREFDADLTNDEKARSTEWFRMYREIAGESAEPPSPTPYVAMGLLGLLAGVTNAGADLNDRSFAAALDRFDAYRYDAIAGRVLDPENMLFTLRALDGSRIGDVARVAWDPTMTSPGAAGPGGYRYLEKRRYRPEEL